MTFLEVSYCGSALLRGTFASGDGHVCFIGEFVFCTHTIFIFFDAFGYGLP